MAGCLGGRRWRTVVLGLAAALALGSVGCGASEDLGVSIGGSPWDSPDIASGYWMAAAAGPDLVIVSDPAAGEPIEPLSASIRLPDGSIRPLPPVPLRGQLRISSVGDSVAVGGIECTNDACDESLLAFALLEEDRASWRRLDVPETVLGGEVEINAPQVGRHDHGLFVIGGGVYSVAPSGQVSTPPGKPFPPSETDFGCAAGDTSVAVQGKGVPGSELGGMISVVELVGDAQVRQLGAPEAGWTSLGPVPPGVRTQFSELCTEHQFSFHDGTREVVLDISSGQWSERQSNLVELLGNPIFIFGPTGVATSVDGSTNYLLHNGQVLSQDPSGIWTPTEHAAAALYSTSDAVLAYDSSTNTFNEIGPG